jgi:hypothetical protein
VGLSEFIPQATVRSTTARTLERTAFLEPLDAQMRAIITAYFRQEPEGTQVTLAVLSGLGKARLKRLEKESKRTFDEVKQCVGLKVPILLAKMFGDDHVATYRDPATKKASTRSRSANWPDLAWVSRYTPHQVSTKGRKPLRSTRSNTP